MCFILLSYRFHHFHGDVEPRFHLSVVFPLPYILEVQKFMGKTAFVCVALVAGGSSLLHDLNTAELVGGCRNAYPAFLTLDEDERRTGRVLCCGAGGGHGRIGEYHYAGGVDSVMSVIGKISACSRRAEKGRDDVDVVHVEVVQRTTA